VLYNKEFCLKKFIKNWILPPKVAVFLWSQVTTWRVKRLDLRVLKKNIHLKDKYKGKRCFILGNAPTIKDIDITLLKDEYVFVMSTFYHHPDFCKLKKSFFSSVHFTAVMSEKEELLYLKEIEKSTNTAAYLFFGIEQKKYIDKYSLFKNKNLFYIASSSKVRAFDISTITRSYATNIIQTLEIAMYLGFKEIYLHSVNINEICKNGKYEYFFDRSLMLIKDPGVNNDSTIKDFFSTVNSMANAFNELKIVNDYAKKNKIKICYTNKESLLKFFEYKNFNELIKK